MLGQVNLEATALVPEKYAAAVSGLNPGALEGSVGVIERRPGDIHLRVTSERDALLVYSEAWAPGWRATINSAQQPVMQVDSALLGVVVPAGVTEVRLYYLPTGWLISRWVTPISTLLAAITIFILWKREQRLPERRTPITKAG
jgi:hypothetical protein